MENDARHESLLVEVSCSPLLYPHKLVRQNFITVVADILRASTSICAALEYGVKEIIPVAGSDEARELKKEGYIVACERNGRILDFADLGNSPSEFMNDKFRGKTIAYSTTNGTKTIQLASDADRVVIGSFINISALAGWLISQQKNVVILCAAWKNLFNLEDTLFAGALAGKILQNRMYFTECDATKAALDLWSLAEMDPANYLSKSSHRNRLKHIVSEKDFRYTVTPDSTGVVPVVGKNGNIHRWAPGAER